MIVMLVQVTTVAQLIERVKKGKFRSREDILAQRTCPTFLAWVYLMQPVSGKQAAKVEDDDIVAGPQKTTLKCPVRVPLTLAVAALNVLHVKLSYGRITTPCRSSHCVHVQCFDALSWYSLNEQTTTWSCPVCEKSINHEDLIVDGYANYVIQRLATDSCAGISTRFWKVHLIRLTTLLWRPTASGIHPTIDTLPIPGRKPTNTGYPPSVLRHVRITKRRRTVPLVTYAMLLPRRGANDLGTLLFWILRKKMRVRSNANCHRRALSRFR